MVIDMRLRPPTPGFVRSTLYQNTGLTEHPEFARLPSTTHRSVPMLVGEMDAAGVEMGVVPGRHSLEPFGTAPTEELVRLAEKYPGRFLVFAGLDLRGSADEMLKELRRWTRRQGVVGVSIEPTIGLNPSITGVADRGLYPVYEYCAQHELPISITLSAVLQGITRQPYERSNPIQLYQIAHDFPKLQIHVGHAAYPWVMEMIGICMTCPNVWLSPDLYMSSLFPGAQEYAKAAVSYFPTRTVFGTGYPVKPFAAMIDAYKEWNWPKAVEQQIFRDNARRLMHLE